MSIYGKSKQRINLKVMLWMIPPTIAFSFLIYGKLVWAEWPIWTVAILVLIVVWVLKSLATQHYESEDLKSLEVHVEYLKLIDPEDDYEGYIRFKDVKEAEISSKSGNVNKIIFRMKNTQTIEVSNYEGLEHAASSVRNSDAFPISET